MRQIPLLFGLYIWRCYKQSNINKFEAWCRKVDDDEVIRWDGDAVDVADDREFRKLLIDKLAQAKGAPSILNLPIRVQGILSNGLSVERYVALSTSPKLYAELSAEIFAEPRRFGHIKIIGDGIETLTLRNAYIRKLETYSVPRLDAEDCEIGDIRVHHRSADYHITRCMIGNFVVVKEKDKVKDKDELCYHVQDLSWIGGYLGQFDLWQEKSPAFVGNASFHWITLPRTVEPHRVQWLRDAREAFTARNNLIAASIFHASELKLARPKEWFKIFHPYWLASWAYQVGSNFGNSIGLPLFWLFIFYVSIGVVAYYSGTEPNVKASAGWFTGIKAHGWCPEVLRAGVYAAQSILNPLNLFVTEPLVSVSNGWGVIASLVLGVFGIASLALFFLSLRRRFKLE